MPNPTVAIIGGGATGIGVAKCLRQAGISFNIYERAGGFGGNWRPNGPSSKMYESAHLISSKRNTEFSDAPMPKNYPSYPSHSLFFTYLNAVVSEFDLARSATFNFHLEMLRPDGDRWLLEFANGESRIADFVVICNGLLRRALVPDIAGKFEGISLHAADYKNADSFRRKRVLVVGAGNSGCDIAVDAAHNASRTFHSTRHGYHYMPKFIAGKATQDWLMDEAPKFVEPEKYWEYVESTFKLAGFDGTDYGLPKPDHPIQSSHPIMNSQILFHIGHGDITPKGDIADIIGNEVLFNDGSSEEFDVIVWATGYEIDMPFLERSVFDWKDDFHSLFLRMIPPEFDNLIFAGYLNSPSGIGNLANSMGHLVSKYISARKIGGTNWRTLQKVKHHARHLDLGTERFVKSRRHNSEVDLWKFLHAINYVTSKLHADIAPRS